MMDNETKINLEGMPLATDGAHNIHINAGKHTKLNSANGTVVHLKTEKTSPHDVSLHINTSFSIGSIKKIRVLFIVNFLLSVICMIISCSAAFYYWNEMITMRKQLEVIKDQYLIQNFKENGDLATSASASALQIDRPLWRRLQDDRKDSSKGDDIKASARRFYVEDWNNRPILLMDSKNKNQEDSEPEATSHDNSLLQKKDTLVAHFVGAESELTLKGQIIGPWIADFNVSNSQGLEKIVLSPNSDYVTIKEDGLYMVYAQVVYLTHLPNTYYIWARKQPEIPRLLTTCATGDDSSQRRPEEAQISCSIQTVARLRKGETLNLSQREKNITIWLKPGFSYFGLVKIGS